MQGLRRSSDNRQASDSLAQLTLNKRGVQLVGSEEPAAATSTGPRAAAGAASGAADAKATKSPMQSATAATKTAATAAHGTAAATAALSGERDSSEQAADRSRDVFARASQNVGEQAARGTATVVRGGAKASANAVKGGIVAAQKRVAAAKAAQTAKSAKSAADSAVTVSRGAAALSRAGAATAAAVKSIVAAVAAAASSTPVIAIVSGVLVAVVAILSLISWLPGITSPETQEPVHTGNFAIEDDYPFKGHGYTTMNPNSGYAYGNCTDFVWWRINRDAGVSADTVRAGDAPMKWADLTPNGGNGNQWGWDGNLPGWKDTRTPVPGDIISVSQQGVLGATTNAPGHVAYVGAVDEAGNVTIESYGRDVYYIHMASISELNAWQDSGAIVIKHNPAGRVGGNTSEPNGDAQSYAYDQLTTVFGSGINREAEWGCLYNLWMGESGWNHTAENPSSGAYGIPQALPGDKMASAGADWRTNPHTQVDWGLQYIRDRHDYGTPCGAWALWQSRTPHWY